MVIVDMFVSEIPMRFDIDQFFVNKPVRFTVVNFIVLQILEYLGPYSESGLTAGRTVTMTHAAFITMMFTTCFTQCRRFENVIQTFKIQTQKIVLPYLWIVKSSDRSQTLLTNSMCNSNRNYFRLVFTTIQ